MTFHARADKISRLHNHRCRCRRCLEELPQSAGPGESHGACGQFLGNSGMMTRDASAGAREPKASVTCASLLVLELNLQTKIEFRNWMIFPFDVSTITPSWMISLRAVYVSARRYRMWNSVISPK